MYAVEKLDCTCGAKLGYKTPLCRVLVGASRLSTGADAASVLEKVLARASSRPGFRRTLDRTSSLDERGLTGRDKVALESCLLGQPRAESRLEHSQAPRLWDPRAGALLV